MVKAENKLQITRSDIEDVATIKANYLHMTKIVDRIDKSIDKQWELLQDFITEVRNNYVTKKEHEDNVKKIIDLEKGINNINLKIALVTWGFTVVLYVIERFLWK